MLRSLSAARVGSHDRDGWGPYPLQFHDKGIQLRTFHVLGSGLEAAPPSPKGPGSAYVDEVARLVHVSKEGPRNGECSSISILTLLECIMCVTLMLFRAGHPTGFRGQRVR